MHDVAIFLILHLGHEGSLVQVRVELLRLAILSRFTGVEPLQTMLLQRAHQDALGHLQARVEVNQVLVCLVLRGIDLLSWNCGERALEVVDRLQKVGSELLDGKGTGDFNVAPGALLEVTEFRDRSEVFVLLRMINFVRDYVPSGMLHELVRKIVPEVCITSRMLRW